MTLYCGDPFVAEELAQETLVRLLDRWGQVQQLTSPAAWAHRVAINLANSRFRRLGAERRARQRLAGRAAVLADLPVAEVATLMECSPGTVKSLTHHAAAALRRAGLVDRDDEVHGG